MPRLFNGFLRLFVPYFDIYPNGIEKTINTHNSSADITPNTSNDSINFVFE